MKTTAKLFVLAVLALALSAGSTMAQNPNAEKGKAHKEEKGGKTEKAKKEVKSEDELQPKGKPEGKGSEGNAYGKNKGEMSGKEFGKMRSADAKLKMKEKRKNAHEKITG
ncbi:MAG TPA: hypothetical protein PKW36_13705, partial [bacterium]|nr:hypothetical protein [bacterium]